VVRLSHARDVGLYVRDRRREMGWTQNDLARAAGVSRRWLSDVEAGKPSAEIGLVLRVMHALKLTIEANPTPPPPEGLDLDEILDSLRGGPGRA
jgi:y4mF family transcriptional regulator